MPQKLSQTIVHRIDPFSEMRLHAESDLMNGGFPITALPDKAADVVELDSKGAFGESRSKQIHELPDAEPRHEYSHLPGRRIFGIAPVQRF